MKFFIKTNWQVIVLLVVAIIFLFIYSWFPYQTTKDGDTRFASPDGTANYFWAERYAQGEELFYFEPLNVVADDIVIPRSVRSDNGVVKPVSFLGIILIYGWLGKIFGTNIIIYLTPLFAVIGVLFFYGIIKEIFNKKIAFFSALMLFALAPYWYYTSRSMFHNVLFIDLVMAGVWFLIYKKNVAVPRPYVLMPFLSGIFIGLAIITRVSELIWLVPAMLIAWVVYFKEIEWNKLILFACGIFLALMPMLYYNQILYGDFLDFGYSSPANQYAEVPNSSLRFASSELSANPEFNDTSLRDKINNFLPFGFHPRAAWNNFVNYFVIIFWYLFWPAFFGGIWFLYNWKKINKTQKIYFCSFVVASIILVTFYGSWVIHDNINLSSITIGNSYTRYWLLMYIMAIPLAVLFFEKITNLIKQKYIQNILLYSLIIIFLILNIQAAVFAKEECLLVMKENIIKDKKLANEIINKIEPEAIIINKHFDKYLWPERKVIIDNLSNKNYYKLYAQLIDKGLPLYYYGFIFQEEALINLNEAKLNKDGLQIEIINLDEKNKLGLYQLKVN